MLALVSGDPPWSNPQRTSCSAMSASAVQRKGSGVTLLDVSRTCRARAVRAVYGERVEQGVRASTPPTAAAAPAAVAAPANAASTAAARRSACILLLRLLLAAATALGWQQHDKYAVHVC